MLSTITLAGCGYYDAPVKSYQVASKGVYSAAISNSGDKVIIASIHHGGSLWNHHEQARLFNWNHNNQEPSTLTSTDFSYDEQWALTSESHTMVLWNPQTGESERFWTAPGEILDAKLGPQANTALLGLNNHSAVLLSLIHI